MPSNPVRGALCFENVFVGRVPRGTTEEQLRAAFALVGAEVGAIELVLDRVTGLPRGFAFISLRGRIAAHTDALELGLLRLATLDGHPLDVQRVPSQRSAPRTSPVACAIKASSTW
jgi:hypothetical protein